MKATDTGTSGIKTLTGKEVKAGRFLFRFPDLSKTLSQDEEWFDVHLDGEWKSFRMHDYDEMFAVPGLYEALVYDVLGCRSPHRLMQLLDIVLEDNEEMPSNLDVLEIGAGNGCVGELLKEAGARSVTGIDIIPEAKEAARRDRPEVYDEYLVTDLTHPDPRAQAVLENRRFNCLAVVAALGFGDIPPEAFASALDAIETPGWIALTIKEDFLTEEDQSGFSRFLQAAIDLKFIDVDAQARILHRKSIDREPLYYVAFIGRKVKEIPTEALLG